MVRIEMIDMSICILIVNVRIISEDEAEVNSKSESCSESNPKIITRRVGCPIKPQTQRTELEKRLRNHGDLKWSYQPFVPRSGNWEIPYFLPYNRIKKFLILVLSEQMGWSWPISGPHIPQSFSSSVFESGLDQDNDSSSNNFGFDSEQDSELRIYSAYLGYRFGLNDEDTDVISIISILTMIPAPILIANLSFSMRLSNGSSIPTSLSPVHAILKPSATVRPHTPILSILFRNRQAEI